MVNALNESKCYALALSYIRVNIICIERQAMSYGLRLLFTFRPLTALERVYVFAPFNCKMENWVSMMFARGRFFNSFNMLAFVDVVVVVAAIPSFIYRYQRYFAYTIYTLISFMIVRIRSFSAIQ